MFKNPLLILLILCVTLISFLPSLKNGFTNWDDDKLLTENTVVRSLSWQNTKTIFTSFSHELYHPLVLLSYSLEYHFFKLDPRAYHATNLFLHLVNCILVFWLIFSISGNSLISFIVSLLFAIHPAHVESVAWVSERKDVLYALFFLAGLISYIRFLKEGKQGFYWTSLGLFAASCLSKAMAVSFPLVILLCERIFGEKTSRKKILNLAPFFIIALVIGALAILAKQQTLSLTEEPPLSKYNLLNIPYKTLFYIVRAFIPVNFLYLYPYSRQQGFLAPVFFWLPLGILIILAIGIFFSARYSRKIIFGFLFFGLTIFPAIPLMNVGYSADRYTYIPFIGLFYVMGEAGIWACRGLSEKNKIRIFCALILASATVGLSYLTWQKCLVWKDNLSLWNDAVRSHPHLAMFYIKRGNAYLDKMDFSMAIADYKQAMALNPSDFEAYYNRGITYSQKGEFKLAIEDYSHAILFNPLSWPSFVNRGVVYFCQDDYSKAIADFNAALRINPNSPDAYFYRANAFSRKGEYDNAVLDYTSALRLNPNYARAYYNRELIKKEGLH